MSNAENTTRSNRTGFLIFIWYLVMLCISAAVMEQTSDFYTTAFLVLTVLALGTLTVVGLSLDPGFYDVVGRIVFTVLKFLIWAGFICALLATLRLYLDGKL